jgi:uncharacterized protein (DUF1330 family)
MYLGIHILKKQMNTNTLGYICLVLTQHIGNHIKDNIDDNLKCMVRILGKHGNFNRIEFGGTLWNSVHGCLISFPSSAAHTDLLESHQYQAANVTIRTKMNILKYALLAEQGWEPINAFLDQKVSLFFRF